MTKEAIINEDIAVLTSIDGDVSMVPVYRAMHQDDCAMIPLGPDGSVPPCLTVGDVDGSPKAIYFDTGLDDVMQANAEYQRSGEDRYVCVETPLGVVKVSAFLVKPF